MQTKIIRAKQLHGNAINKEHGRLYLGERDGAAYTKIKRDGNLSISIEFDCLMNITGISIQGKSSAKAIQFTKRYAVNVSYGNQDSKLHVLEEVERKYLFIFFHQFVYLIKSNMFF